VTGQGRAVPGFTVSRRGTFDKLPDAGQHRAERGRRPSDRRRTPPIRRDYIIVGKNGLTSMKGMKLI
jgi:hypothetical protein